MSERLLAVSMFLAYGPLALIIVLYLVSLVLKAQGRPGLLATLIRMTSVPEPVKRRVPITPEHAPTEVTHH